ncbi:YsnF/AvaK domain-containing protein [Planococcus shixiaomingii]|uniref:YsnF/AvaK domain-containing protein n=1 Tax=Planococcus shixiaomingii TaxID=3058393 RepID=UPI002617EC06|nr:YsnF/AvaK domain-containing protein [Planococcus sp. N022]WKA56540.1 YsnF/AvaK domain-containing protein [Planococcus sp. N022]
MASKENTFIGVFDNQEEILNKVEELKGQGHKEDHMYVVGRDNNSFSTLDTQTGVHVDATNDKKKQGFVGKVMSALSGDASLEAFKGMGLERYEAKEYYEHVQSGKLVLYVDEDYGNTYDKYGTGYSNSSGIEQTAPIETGVTFAKSGSTVDEDSTNNASSTNTSNTFGADTETGASIKEKSGGRFNSLADADSEFGKSITAEGSSLDEASGPTDAPFASTSQSTNTSGSISGSSDSTRDTTDRSIDFTTDAGSSVGSSRGAAGSSDAFGSTADITDEERMLLHEERLSVDKERVQTGEVNVGKHVVEENQSIEVPVEREEVYVERHAVNEEADDTEAFQENDTIHVPVSEERVNVTKKEVVTEEIVISKRKVQDTEQVNETVRREVAEIDEDTTDFNDKNTNNNNRK